MPYRRKISDRYTFTSATRERVVEEYSDDETDPHPSFPPMRAVRTTDGETIAEVTMPLRKCAGERRVKQRRTGT